MTPHLTTEAFAALGAPNLVYVRPIKAREVLTGAPIDADDDLGITPDQTLYALHSADGSRLAVMVDRETALAAAFAHELAPVSVH